MVPGLIQQRTRRGKTQRVLLAGLFAILAASARADTFGSGPNQFTIDFVTVGNPGNGDDTGLGGGFYSSPAGGVSYFYRMGVTEVPEDWIVKATASGLTNVTAGTFSGLQPATNMTWYEAAAFVNWLNISTGHHAAYDLTFNGGWSMSIWSSAESWQLGGENRYRHKDAYYFLPSEDEWYKAAYHKNDGVTANYWDFPTAGNAVPTAAGAGTTAGSAVYNSATSLPVAVNSDGGLSAYGTRGQGGNVVEWLETAADGINDAGDDQRLIRGGDWRSSEVVLRSSTSAFLEPTVSGFEFGLRIASIPEPSSALLLGSGGLLALARRRRRGPSPA